MYQPPIPPFAGTEKAITHEAEEADNASAETSEKPEGFNNLAMALLFFALLLAEGTLLVLKHQAAAPSPITTWLLDYGRFGAAVEDVKISPTARQFLRYDSGESKSIFLPNGSRVQVIDLRWNGGEVSAAAARLHKPEICLPAIGYRFEGAVPDASVEIDGRELTFSGSQFRTDAGLAYVYRVMWENGEVANDADGYDQSLRSAIRAVRERRVLRQARVLMIMINGPTDPDRAAEVLSGFLQRAVVASSVFI